MTRFKILLIAGDTAELVADIPPPARWNGSRAGGGLAPGRGPPRNRVKTFCEPG